ncbi:hypothetical protein HFO46_22610 [Rhizobium leguminosarum]|nr:hypothetical protein [Rhizobium leguminosarum]
MTGRGRFRAWGIV